ncbi:hypothetical protein D6T63_14295, partial [Arthrobacter cheniae]
MKSPLPRPRFFPSVTTTVAALLVLSLAGCTPTPKPPNESEPPAGAVQIAAVGDMNGPKTSKRSSPSGRNGAAITQLVQDEEIDAFLGLGDFQYDTAYCADYVKYWTKLWGGTMPKLYWVSAPN